MGYTLYGHVFVMRQRATNANDINIICSCKNLSGNNCPRIIYSVFGYSKNQMYLLERKVKIFKRLEFCHNYCAIWGNKSYFIYTFDRCATYLQLYRSLSADADRQGDHSVTSAVRETTVTTTATRPRQPLPCQRRQGQQQVSQLQKLVL